MSPTNINEQLALITCSYRPDFERCARLCASVDALISPDTAHFIIVPDRDRKIFSTLESKNRTILSTEDVLPGRFLQLPLFKKWWLDDSMWPIRGWMVQQVTKLCADVVTSRENIIFVDSDIEFLKPLQHDRLLRDGALRLHRKPGHKNEGVHLKWHHASAELLGFSPRYFGSDYIGALASWRRSNVVHLKRHIEERQERPWHEAVGRRMTVSEYTLYGVFVEHVIGIEESGHFHDPNDLCQCLWFKDETEKFLNEIDHRDSPQAVLLQSNIGLSPEATHTLMSQLRKNMAASQLG
ncbi:hypothetical protein EYC98_06815 [Halieaceae bacterium IMCC14734]|uniref:Nucleotide-diphospho-sugar transferase domain-containing protein n=1 Tax=Candidatus Litorirhabdus singularis TaxID=2518993 RepID=A0ABT3TFJ5_9GAMM|nr:DUF6492 family protein [Candidatus Litorirhabdus singularis]MCX2980585.1 hypothetical protein [Candidatus Litorirhabdus singularis]